MEMKQGQYILRESGLINVEDQSFLPDLKTLKKNMQHEIQK